MRKLTSAILVASLAVLVPCVANGAGTEGVKAPSEAMGTTAVGAAASAETRRSVELPGEVEGDSPLARRGVTLKSVMAPKDLPSVLSTESPNGFVPNTWYYHYVNGQSFLPSTSAVGYASLGNSCVYQTTGSPGWFLAPIHLPHLAIVQYARFYYDKTVGGTDVQWWERFDPSVPTHVDVFSNTTVTTTGAGSVLSALQSEVVDNYTYSYALYWRPGTIGSADQLCGVRVAYYMPPTGTYTPITPCRQIFPTAVTSTQQNLQLTGGTCGVPTGATAVTANVTTFSASGTGYLAIWPQGTSWPNNSTVNYSPGLVVANSADLVLSAMGQVSAMCQTGQTVQMILDITGYFY